MLECIAWHILTQVLSWGLKWNWSKTNVHCEYYSRISSDDFSVRSHRTWPKTRAQLVHFHLKLPDAHQLYTDVRETPPFYYKLQPLPVKEPPNQRRSLSCDDHFCMQAILLNHNSARNSTLLSTWNCQQLFFEHVKKRSIDEKVCPADLACVFSLFLHF